MTEDSRSPLATDRMKKAVRFLSEQVRAHPDKTRRQLLHEVNLKFDLSPLECDFLDKYFADKT